jgi:flagellar motor switch protein FliM
MIASVSDDKAPAADPAVAEETAPPGERLPMLEVGLERLARSMQTALRKYADDKVSVSLQPLQDLRFGAYLRQAKPPLTFYIARIETTGAPVLLVSQGDLVQLAVDLLLKSRQPAVAGPDRPFTATERILTERLLRLVVQEIGTAFQPIAELNLKLERTESNPRFLTAVREKDGILVARIALAIDGRKGGVDLLIPHASLEPYRDLLRQNYAGDRFGRDSLWERHLTQELLVSSMRITAILDETAVPLRDVINWKVGSVLPLDMSANEPIRLQCGESAVFFGSMGRHDDRVVVRIDGKLDQ